MDEALRAINGRLKAGCVPVRVIPKGKNLALRATLPRKPKDGAGTKQYDISLGVSGSKDGLRRAEREANKLAQSMADGSFTWATYAKPERSLEERPASEWIQEFKAHYMKGSKIKETTWANTWAATFKKLPQDGPLRDSLLLSVVLSTEEDSRNRELTCQRLQRLAEFVGIAIDLKPYLGNYEPEPRDIPADELIVEWRDRIPDPARQWAYGVIAAFGIRPHEVFECQSIDALTLQVDEGTKTGARVTRAIRPEWADAWGLAKVVRPETKAQGHRARGQTVSDFFRAYGVPFHPYDLRHAWAIRASVTNGMPLPVAAKMMGHSVETHTRQYHRWLSEAENQRVYETLILKKPPSA